MKKDSTGEVKGRASQFYKMLNKAAERRPQFIKSSTEKVDQYDDEIKSILGVLGHTESLVTDESRVSDFLSVFVEPEEIDVILDQLRGSLNVEVMDEYDLLIEVAERIRKND